MNNTEIRQMSVFYINELRFNVYDAYLANINCRINILLEIVINIRVLIFYC